MNLYRVNTKRNHVRGFQMEQESYVVVATDRASAEKIVQSRIGNNVIVISSKRVQDQAYLVSETYLTDTVS